MITPSFTASPIRPGAEPAGAPSAAIRGRHLDRCVAILAGGIAVAVPFAAFAVLTLHHFYVRGSFLLDAGWTAYLVSHGGLLLPYPQAFGGGSYYHWHVGPILAGFGLLHRVLPLSDIQYFAVFLGLCHALPGLAVFWVLRSGYGLRRGIGILGAALVAGAFGFNGIALAIARYPHSEILAAGAIMLFAAALVMRRPAIATLCLAVALLTREDAGLHVFGLLAVLVAVNRWYGLPWRQQRPELGFAAAGLAYAIVVLTIQRLASAVPSTMAITYLGDPAFAHLSAGTVLLRLHFLLPFRAYLILPALVACLWAVRTGNPYILVGYIACMPWVMLQLVAQSDIAATLSGYYAYPLMIASFWPLLGVLLHRPQADVRGGTAMPTAMFAVMVAASFVATGRQYNPGRLDLPAAFLSPPSLTVQAATHGAIAALTASIPQLGHLAADTSVVALAPDLFTPAETVLTNRSTPLNAVVYLMQGFDRDKARRLAAEAALTSHYQVRGTTLRLAVDHPVPPEAPIAAWLAPAEPPD